MSETPRDDARKLRKLNFDLANYFSNTIIPQLFVDADLILRIFTPPAMQQFSLTYDHVGENISDIRDNLRYPNVIEDIQEVINNKNTILEKEVQTTDGLWFQMNIVPYVEYEKDVINGVIITFVDITKRFIALRDLEKLNSEYQTLRYALAHDIRQPISTITLIADGLSLVPQQQNSNSNLFGEWSNTLKESTKNLEVLVEDFAYKKEKENSPKVRLLNVEDICQDIITALKWEIKKKKIKLTTDLMVKEITFPRSSFRSVVYNLIHNAVKFSDPEKSSEINITTEEVKGFIILCIQDNGLGISLEHQRRIFKKSSRLSNHIPGTGMGLYVVKKMIEDNEGRIKLESEEKKGTTFKVFFKSHLD